jgi:uncharacterized OB-fold protein
MQTFGCERCGKSGEALKPRALRANGKLTTASVVYIHADKHRPAPFAIGVIALDEGPVICTLLLDLDLAKEAQQKRVAGEWVQIALGDGSQAFDLRFRPEAKDTASQVER